MLTNTYVKSVDEALAEIQRRRASSEGADLMHRYEPSPYGGYCVHSTFPEFALGLDDGGDVVVGGVWRRHG